MYFKFIVVLITIILQYFVNCGHIYSWDPQYEYDGFGNIIKIKLFFKCETSISSQDYVKIESSFNLDNNVPNSVYAKLVIEENDITFEHLSKGIGNLGIYYFQFENGIEKNMWHRIDIHINTQSFGSTPYIPVGFQNSIKMYTVSSTGPGQIIYDFTKSLGQIYQMPLLNPPNNGIGPGFTQIDLDPRIQFQGCVQTPQQKYPGNKYTIDISVKISITSEFQYKEGSIFYLTIDDSVGDNEPDFKFQGECFSYSDLTQDINQLQSNCTISENGNQIKLIMLDEIYNDMKLKVQATILNPSYYAQNDILIDMKTLTDNRQLIQTKVFRDCQPVGSNLVLKTQQLNLNAIYGINIKFLWGFQYKHIEDAQGTHTTDPTRSYLIDQPITLFQQKDIGQQNPINSVYIGFKINDYSPIDSKLRVMIQLYATGIVEGSVATNFPNYSPSEKVKCYYRPNETTQGVGEEGILICDNVGPFSDIELEYFVSLKIFYSQSYVGDDCSTNNLYTKGFYTDPLLQKQCLKYFGQILIKSLQYNSQNNIIEQELYYVLQGLEVPLIQSTDMTDKNGWGDETKYKFGQTQVISYEEDLSSPTSSTQNAVQQIMNSNTASIGIFPDSSLEQQLLFFIYAPANTVNSYYCGTQCSNTNQIIRMHVIFNTNVINFENGTESKGIDFVASNGTPHEFFSGSFSCYDQSNIRSNSFCKFYDQNTEGGIQSDITQENNIQLINDEKGLKYGQAIFDCGGQSATSSLATLDTVCNLFQGYSSGGASNSSGGVFSFRNIKFPHKFQTQLYADDQVLDFVIVFKNLQSDGTETYISSTLINAYTLINTKLNNIKVSYVNYYQDVTNSNSNTGQYIPIILRIGGSILDSQSQNCEQLHIFFDDHMDIQNFYEDSSNTGTYDIGCSTQNCQYYPALNVEYNYDIWMSSKRVTIQNLPSLNNEFQILIPIHIGKIGKAPTHFTLSFTKTGYQINDINDLYQNLGTYRIYGSAIQENVVQPMQPINNIQLITDVFDFTSDFTIAGNTGDIQILNADLQNIGAGLENKNISLDTTTLVIQNMTPGTQFGAGLTMSSLHYNIFRTGTGIIDIGGDDNIQPQSNYKCSSFYYKYNPLTPIGVFEENKYNNIMFCPYDDILDGLTEFKTNEVGQEKVIKLNDLEFNQYFSEGYNLGSNIKYSISQEQGQLVFYQYEKQDVQSPSQTNDNTCVSESTIYSISPGSTGRQRLQFKFQMPKTKIKLDETTNNGFSEIKIIITYINNSLIPTAFSDLVNIPGSCQIISPQNIFSGCTHTLSSNGVEYLFTVDTGVETTLEKETIYEFYNDVLYNTLNSTPNLYYQIQIQLSNTNVSPNPTSLIYGNNPGDFTKKSIFSQCNSQKNIQFGSTQYVSDMLVYEPQFSLSKTNNLLQEFKIKFSGLSARPLFFETSHYEVDVGYLEQNNDLKCQIYEIDEGSSQTIISDKFLAIDLSQYISNRIIKILPKTYFANPKKYTFTLQCQGFQMPSSPPTTNAISVKWVDGTDTLEQGSSNVYSSSLYNNYSDISPSLQYKIDHKFSSENQDSFYTFNLKSPQELNFQTKIYVTFPFNYSPGLNREKQLECLIGFNINQIADDQTTRETFCDIISDQVVMLQINSIISANIEFYIEIFGVTKLQKNEYTVPIQQIQISIDVDGNLQNGIEVNGFIDDIQPTNSFITIDDTPADYKHIQIKDTQISQNLIRNNFDLTILVDLPLDTIIQNQLLYIQLTSHISESYQTRQEINCDLTKNVNNGYNYAGQCIFSSKKIIQLQIAITDPDNESSSGVKRTLYKIVLYNLYAPSYIPEHYWNKIYINVFTVQRQLVSGNIELSNIGLDNQSMPFYFENDVSKIDLSWNFYNFQRDTQNVVTSNYEGSNEIIIYTGYYQKNVVLVPDNNEPFLSDFSFTFEGLFIENLAFRPVDFNIKKDQESLQFLLAAKSGSSSGVYTYQAPKSQNNLDQIYTNLPPLKIILKGDPCNLLRPKDMIIEVPEEGKPLTIIIDMYNCLPVEELTINAVSDDPNMVLDEDLSVKTITTLNTEDTYLYYQFYEKNLGQFKNGDQITINFQVDGIDSQYFNNPLPVLIRYVQQTNDYTQKPIAEQINNIKVQENFVEIDLSCNTQATIYWAIGKYPSLFDTEYQDIFNNIIDNKQGIQANYTVQGDPELKTYGIEVLYDTQPKKLRIENLKSETNYNIKYFCVNTLGKVSDPVQEQWLTPNNGAFLIKLTLDFDQSLTYGQNNKIACAIDLSMDHYEENRVLTEISTYCNQQPHSQVINNDIEYVKPYIANIYQYHFYIIPDYLTKFDEINIKSKKILEQLNFVSNLTTKYLPLVDSDGEYYPNIVQMEFQEIVKVNPPILLVKNFDINISTIEFQAQIQNEDGFVIVGIKEGRLKSEIPSVRQLQLSQNSDGSKLLQQDMRFTTQDSLVAFRFQNLMAETDYTFFAVSTIDDPSEHTIADEIYVKEFRTLSDETVLVSSQILHFNIILFLVIVINIYIQ